MKQEMKYEEFVEWHTAHGNEDVPEKLLKRMWILYTALVEEFGKEYADDKICGHEGWTDEYANYLNSPLDPRD